MKGAMIPERSREAAVQSGSGASVSGRAGRAWRSYELAVLYSTLQRSLGDSFTPQWDVLLRGYSSIRPLPTDLKTSLPRMLLVRIISWVGGNAATLPLRLGTQPFEQDVMAKAVARARKLAAALED